MMKNIVTKKDVLEQFRPLIAEIPINGRLRSQEEVDSMLESINKATSVCLLCKDKATAIGMFLPEDSQEFGAASGKTRNFFYGTCDEHLGDADSFEKKIVEDYVGLQ